MEEEIVQFNAYSDRINFEIQNAETKQTMCIISGYDLDIDFNADALNNVDEIEACLDGMKNLFRDFIMETLLKKQTEK